MDQIKRLLCPPPSVFSSERKLGGRAVGWSSQAGSGRKRRRLSNPEQECGGFGCRRPCCVIAPRGDADESDEEHVERAKRRRLGRRCSAPPQKAASTTAQMLARGFPLRSGDSLTNRVADALLELEKYEMAVQGDDYDESELSQKATNAEALAYACAAAAVRSLPWPLSTAVEGESRTRVIQRLPLEPYVGEFRTRQVYELATTGTCDASWLEVAPHLFEATAPWLRQSCLEA